MEAQKPQQLNIYLMCQLVTANSNSNKATEKQKISWRGPNTHRIFKACRERSKKLNTHMVSKNLGNGCCALTLGKNSSAYTESRQGPYTYHKLQTYLSD